MWLMSNKKRTIARQVQRKRTMSEGSAARPWSGFIARARWELPSRSHAIIVSSSAEWGAIWFAPRSTCATECTDLMLTSICCKSVVNMGDNWHLNVYNIHNTLGAFSGYHQICKLCCAHRAWGEPYCSAESPIMSPCASAAVDDVHCPLSLSSSNRCCRTHATTAEAAAVPLLSSSSSPPTDRSCHYVCPTEEGGEVKGNTNHPQSNLGSFRCSTACLNP